MSKPIPKRSQKAGLPPGTPMYIGENPAEVARITIIHYNETELQEKEVGGNADYPHHPPVLIYATFTTTPFRSSKPSKPIAKCWLACTTFTSPA